MRRYTKALGLIIAMVALTLPASATTLTLFTSEAAFGPPPNTSTITFDGLAPQFPTTFLGTACVPSGAGPVDCSVNIEGFIGTDYHANVVTLRDPATGEFNWGTGDVAGQSTAQGAAFNGHTSICLTADAASANGCQVNGTASSTFFSIELMMIEQAGGTVAVFVRTVDDTVQEFDVVTSTTTRTFFGVKSDGSLISSVTLVAPSDPTHYVIFDNIQYQGFPNDQPGSVPEPASLALLGSGALAAAAALRKKLR